LWTGSQGPPQSHFCYPNIPSVKTVSSDYLFNWKTTSTGLFITGWNPNLAPDLLVNFLLEAIKYYQTFIYQFPATKI
jgi:hypothetical protein